MDTPSSAISALEEQIGYAFQQKELLELAMTHPSWVQEDSQIPAPSNQRLEFLGDSVLGLLVSELLYHCFPGEPEGTLTRQKAALVKGPTLVSLAEKLDLDRYIRVGKSESQAGIRGRNSRLEDALEAIIGAAYLDGGLHAGRRIVKKLYEDPEALLETQEEQHNAKGKFQEYVQERGGTTASFSYEMTGYTGPDHDRNFRVELTYKGRIVGRGEARTRKAAESHAAREALRHLQSEDGPIE